MQPAVVDIQQPETAAPPAALTRQSSDLPSSRRSKVDEDGKEQVTPGCFSRNLIKCPCVVMWGTFVAAIVVAAIPLVSGRVIPSLSFAIMLDTDTVPEQVDNKAGLLIQDSDDKYEAPTRITTEDDGLNQPLRFYYEGLGAGRNMFTVDAIAAVATYERALLELNGWTKHCTNATSRFGPNAGETRCASPQTVLRFLYTNAPLEQKQCEAGYCFAPQADLAACTSWGTYPCMSTVYDWRDGTLAAEADWPSLFAQVCTKAELTYTKTVLLQTSAECKADTLSSRYVRSLYQVYSPYNESETKEDRGFADMEEGFVEDLVTLLDETKDKVSATKIYDSKVATGGRAVNVWWDGYWTGHLGTITQVLVLQDMMMAIFSVIVVAVILVLNTGSVLLCLAGLFEIIISIFLAMFCWLLLGQNQVTALELMGIFLILCVGADDIFVFTDTWKESAFMPPQISGTLLTRFSWTYTRAAGAMLTTTATTAVSLLISGFSAFPMVQAFGLFNMFIVICDYLLVITWFAATVVCLERLAIKRCPPGKNWECSCCCPGKAQDGQKKERRSTAWFRDTLAPCTFKARWVLIVISMATLAGGIAACATNFEDGELANIPDSHPGFINVGGRIQRIADDEFGDADKGRVQTFLYYGMADPPVSYPKSINIYQSNDEHDDYEDYVDSFELKLASGRFGPEQQVKMVADCKALSANDEIVHNDQYHCLLRDLKDHVGEPAFPFPSEALLRTALEAFYASTRYMELTERYEEYAYYTGFVATPGESGIDALWHSFNSTTPTTTILAGSAIQKYYDPWRAAVDAQCTDIAPCMMTERGFFAYMGVAKLLSTSAIQNIFYALTVAYFILLGFTGNFIVPAIAILSIGSTITWVLASVLLLGYKFDVVASILIVMIVGMSVDYAAHLVHFYNEMDGSRYEKVQGALHGVGVSVIGGAATTAGAAFPLLFTVHFTFFKEMGFFILFTSLWGIFFSFVQLIPILMVCGPVGETGDIRAVVRRIRGACRGGKAVQSSATAAAAARAV